jgi:hypothetical protein
MHAGRAMRAPRHGGVAAHTTRSMMCGACDARVLGCWRDSRRGARCVDALAQIRVACMRRGTCDVESLRMCSMEYSVQVVI